MGLSMVIRIYDEKSASHMVISIKLFLDIDIDDFQFLLVLNYPRLKRYIERELSRLPG
jgi:hypothetical protein